VYFRSVPLNPTADGGVIHSQAALHACNATLKDEGYLKGRRYVLHDRDKKFCTDFCQTLASGDVSVWSLRREVPT